MRKLFISVAALQFALSAATAQPASTSAATQSASLDQPGSISEVLTNRITKPPSHLEILAAPETILVLPLVALHLLPTHLIAGAISQSGIASVYAGGLTANGEQAHIGGMTAAHRSIPFGTKVRVTNLANGKSVIVRINDRGPFSGARIIDLMPATEKALGFSGLTPVTLVVVSLAER
jgi:rare lipoprotein A